LLLALVTSQSDAIEGASSAFSIKVWSVLVVVLELEVALVRVFDAVEAERE
jgi:hypothetical protein